MKTSLNTTVAIGLAALLGTLTPEADAALLVGNSTSNNIVIFDETNGNFLGNFTTPGSGGLRAPDTLTFGPDGNLYVSSGGSSDLNLFSSLYPQDSAVLRFSPRGNFLGVAASGAGLTRPYGNAFGSDGSLFVSSFRTNQILRFDPNTGDFLGVFASDNNNGLGTLNGLNGPNALLFGPDGSLYVATEGTANDALGNLVFPFDSQVLRYRPEQVAGLLSTNTPEVFVPQPPPLPESLGFVSLLGLALAPDQQSLYVSDFAGGIRQYDLEGQLLQILSTNYTGTAPSNNFVGALTFGSGDTANNLFAIGFDFSQNNLGAVLAFNDAQGGTTNFSGTAYTSDSLVRPIGVTAVAAVPEPTTIAGALLALGGLAAARVRHSRNRSFLR
jgi:DNA-binding beta-propeller fold protein YncE